MWLTVVIIDHLCSFSSWIAGSQLREVQNSYNLDYEDCEVFKATETWLCLWKPLHIGRCLINAIYQWRYTVQVCEILSVTCWKCMGLNNLHRFLLHVLNLEVRLSWWEKLENSFAGTISFTAPGIQLFSNDISFTLKWIT